MTTLEYDEENIRVVVQALAPDLPDAHTDPNYREDAVRVLAALKEHWGIVDHRRNRVSSLLVGVTGSQRKMAKLLLGIAADIEAMGHTVGELSSVNGELADMIKEDHNDAED